jgi:hypothetical protein
MHKKSLADAALLKASYDVQNNSCQEGTRLELLRQIDNWVVKENNKVLWLQGTAGVGKSAVASSVCETLSKGGLLGASFFFRRGGGDQAKPNKFFTTIAHQLLLKRPSTEPHILQY